MDLLHTCLLCKRLIFDNVATMVQDGDTFFRHEKCPTEDEWGEQARQWLKVVP